MPAELPPTRRAVVTGLGPVSALGQGRDPFWTALCAGRSGIGPITLFDASGCASRVAGEVRDFDLGAYVEKGSVLARSTPRSVQLALAAAVLALHDAELDVDACDPERLGVYVGTSAGSAEVAADVARRVHAGRVLSPATAFHTIHHSAACVHSSTLNLRGPVHTTSSGCNSGLDALGQALRMIRAGAVDAMLVVGTDCEVTPEIVAVLEASDSLTTRWNDEPARASRPFDKDRDGNVIGEGAAALLVESEAHARARRGRVYARLAGYHLTAAGYNRQYRHVDAEVDLRPYVRALRGAAEDAGWTPHDVDLVFANGSSSVAYDRIEAAAIAEAFGDHVAELPVTSTKGGMGQHGAGSSALQAAAACLAIRRGAIPPTANHETPDPACAALQVVTEAIRYPPQRVLCHAIGLGGFYASVAAFEHPKVGRDDAPDDLTGQLRVRWSGAAHPRYRPKERFRRPLEPWVPVEDGP